MNFVIVDIETTGGSPKNSKITEIAIYKHDGFKIIDHYETLLDPEMDIPPFITNLTGISNSMVKGAPKFFEVAKKIVEFTEDCVFVAHNVGFDYGIIRHEFRTLGFDYRRPHLCTVRASRFLLPGHDSYSLGKLTRALGFVIENRHRAGGDALATANLFTLLQETNSTGVQKFIQEDINPALLHPNLNVDELDNLPNKTGIYKFYDENNILIYIGKSINIKKRVDQHLRNTKTKKGLEMRDLISRIEHEITGSEIVALLQESMLIKQYRPKYNHMLKKSKFPFGLYDYLDDSGYVRMYIGQSSKNQDHPIAAFSTKREGTELLNRWTEEYELCQKLNDLYPTKTACFHHSIKKCKGACVGEEQAIVYNARATKMVDELNLNGESFYIIENGRQKNEKTLILVENGTLVGYGYAPFFYHRQPQFKWRRFIEMYQEDRDAKTIISGYLRKSDKTNLVRI